MIATHAFSTNGDAWYELKDSFRPEREEIRRQLDRLDGTSSYSFILWRLPAGKTLGEASPWDEAEEYLQSAGSAQRMTVELRRMVDGEPVQYVVGRPTGSYAAEETKITWDGVSTTVYANEVFETPEAANLFIAYYESGEVPPDYHLRQIPV